MTEEFQEISAEEYQEQYPEDTPEVQEQAKLMGWTPPKKFRGDPDKFIPAHRFVERAEQELPIARGTIKTMERSLKEMQGKIDRQAEVLERFNDHHKKSIVREFERGMAEAQARMELAVEEGDKEAFHIAKDEVDALLKDAPTEDKPAPAEDKPTWGPALTKAWVEENPWYGEDPSMAKYAHECGEFLKGYKPELSGATPESYEAQLKEITKMVKKRFPEQFTNQNRLRASTVDTGERAAGKRDGRKKTFNDLPDVARKEFQSFEAEIKGYKIDDYLALYNGPWRE